MSSTKLQNRVNFGKTKNLAEAPDLLEVQIADGCLSAALEGEGRLAAGDVDRARGGVLAVERALRAAQHLDLGDVEEVEGRGRDARIVDVVDVDADTLVEPVIGQAEGRADAADLQRRVARIRRGVLDRWRELLQAADIERAGVVDVLPADDRDRERHFLRGLLTAAGGDDDRVLVTRTGSD